MNLTLTGCKFGLESGRAFYSTYLSYAPSVCVFFSWDHGMNFQHSWQYVCLCANANP